MPNPDVIIAGAGIGGLSAAIYLAVAGKRVLVLERNQRVGGKMAEVEDSGFRFDTGPSVITMRPVFEELFTIAGRRLQDYLTLLPVDPLTRYFYPDSTHLDISRDLSATLAQIAALDPRDVEGYLSFLAHAAYLHRITAPVFTYGPPPTLGSFLNVHLMDALRVGADALQSMDTLIRRYVRHPHLRQLLGRFATYVGSSPYLATGTLAVIAHVELNEGVWYPQGGVYAIARAFERLARELGVEIRTGAGVRHIKITRNPKGKARVTGVVLESGEDIPASIVISNMDVASTYEHLRLDSAPFSATIHARSSDADTAAPSTPIRLSASDSAPASASIRLSASESADLSASESVDLSAPVRLSASQSVDLSAPVRLSASESVDLSAPVRLSASESVDLSAPVRLSASQSVDLSAPIRLSASESADLSASESVDLSAPVRLSASESVDLSAPIRLSASKSADLSAAPSTPTRLSASESAPASPFSHRAVQLDRMEPSCSGFVMLLGVEKKHPHLAHHNILFSSDYKREFEQIFKHGQPPDDPTIYIAITSKTDPAHAPPGAENWFVLVNAPAADNRYDWHTHRDDYTRHILDQLAWRGLDIRPHIKVKHVFTPLDLQRMNGARRGALYGVSFNDRFAPFKRPGNRAPQVNGLYFVGGTTHPGGGVPMVTLSGKLVAKMIMEQ